MIRISALLVTLATLTACGADGEPTAPKVIGNTSVSVNSNSGFETKTSIGLQFGGN